MEDHDVSDCNILARSSIIDKLRYSEILDYHNVDAAAQEEQNGS